MNQPSVGALRYLRDMGISCIVSAELLLRLAEQPALTPASHAALLRTVDLDLSFRIRRAELAGRYPSHKPSVAAFSAEQPQRRLYDQENGTAYRPGKLVRSEGDEPTGDLSIDRAYDFFGTTHRFFAEVLGRNSIDDAGLELRGLVHYGTDYANAFWDGEGNMYFGDGDGQSLLDTTGSLDVIGHELAHGVTQYEANLIYSGQSGALNESMSDVFGSLVRQWSAGDSAADADWLIGADIVGPMLSPALRSMKAPGTANDYDNQPATMDDYVRTASDNGGVHINSGIPNFAFFTAATTLGGPAWEAPGKIWYTTLCDDTLKPDASFTEFAALTVQHAVADFGAESAEVAAVRAGWEAAKVALDS